jgi:hypothetical protein
MRKARIWRAFLIKKENSLKTGMDGWRRSADRTRLRTNSLLTGNFTGNSAIFGRFDPNTKRKTAAPQRFSSNSLCSLTGKIFRITGKQSAVLGNSTKRDGCILAPARDRGPGAGIPNVARATHILIIANPSKEGPIGRAANPLQTSGHHSGATWQYGGSPLSASDGLEIRLPLYPRN